MSTEPGIADRLGDVARTLRSPLARDLSGGFTEWGRDGVAELDALLRELPAVEARTPADALALATMTGELLSVLVANADGNAMACDAARSMAQAIIGLKVCLSELAGRPASDFAVLLANAPAGAQVQ